MLKILALDPSGTGTTGICLIKGSQITFKEVKSKEWKEHLTYLAQLNKTFQPQVILFEHTNYINSRGKDMTGLLKLLGALECLPLDHIESIPVHQVKELSKQLFKGTKQIKEIEFKPGRGKGWMFQGKKISLHQLEAYLVYYLWKEKGGKHDAH